MFHQVGVIATDQPSLRFLRREDTTSEVNVFQYTRHIFGARDSNKPRETITPSFQLLHLLS